MFKKHHNEDCINCIIIKQQQQQRFISLLLKIYTFSLILKHHLSLTLKYFGSTQSNVKHFTLYYYGNYVVRDC